MTVEKPHPVSLDQVFFTRCSVIAIPGHVPPDAQISLSPANTLNVVKMTDEPGRYSVAMQCVLNSELDKKFPYSIDMECHALLRADSTLSEDDATRGMYITGHSILYGAIRETVAWLTGRQPYGSLLLGLSVLKTSPPPNDGDVPEKAPTSSKAPTTLRTP